MTAPIKTNDTGVLNARIRIPEHVVFRAFVSETVVLNLNTGKYHGLNPVGGRMLELLGEGGVVREVSGVIAGEFGRAQSEIDADICEFCQDLEARGLVEIIAVGD